MLYITTDINVDDSLKKLHASLFINRMMLKQCENQNQNQKPKWDFESIFSNFPKLNFE